MYIHIWKILTLLKHAFKSTVLLLFIFYIQCYWKVDKYTKRVLPYQMSGTYSWTAHLTSLVSETENTIQQLELPNWSSDMQRELAMQLDDVVHCTVRLLD